MSNLALIGYRGSGKTTIGRLLADRLSRPFVDTDALVEAEAGMLIAQVFAAEGEDGFRQRERVAIAAAVRGGNRVISVGGGAVVDQDNVDRLRAAGRVIWLTASAEVLWDRISQDAASDATRPDLTAGGGLDEVRELLAVRESAYRAAADLTVDTEGRGPDELAATIVKALAAG